MAEGESFDALHLAATEDLGRLVRRLQSLSPHGWQSRRGPVRVALADLVTMNSELEDRPLTTPIVADHSLADAIAVIGGDVLADLVIRSDIGRLVDVRELLQRVLAETR